MFGCGGRFHAGTVLCNIQDDDRDCVDKYVRFIDGASFSQGGDRASINNQMCEVVDGKYIVLVLKERKLGKYFCPFFLIFASFFYVLMIFLNVLR